MDRYFLAATLSVHWPATGKTCSWPMPERLAAFAPIEDDDRLLLGLASGLAFFHFSSGIVECLCDVETDLPDTRLNDGRCDRQGRFVFGMSPGQRSAPVAWRFLPP